LLKQRLGLVSLSTYGIHNQGIKPLFGPFSPNYSHLGIPKCNFTEFKSAGTTWINIVFGSSVPTREQYQNDDTGENSEPVFPDATNVYNGRPYAMPLILNSLLSLLKARYVRLGY